MRSVLACVIIVSLSARRAWIEIACAGATFRRYFVALRKESVDRNINNFISVHIDFVALRKESVDRNNSLESKQIDPSVSLSARRAWIEISSSLDDILAGVVALRKESVDRNTDPINLSDIPASRSPQGERG